MYVMCLLMCASIFVVMYLCVYLFFYLFIHVLYLSMYIRCTFLPRSSSPLHLMHICTHIRNTGVSVKDFVIRHKQVHLICIYTLNSRRIL